MGRVIVGLNSDESVRRLKGDRRPIIPEDDRAQMLRALRSVDWVHIFEEDTPLELIKRVRPNVIVKGPEWRGREREVVGSDLAEIVTYPYGRQDVTTSGIVGRIIERYR
jgi:rfaE bifunctional protein nucleotidyltransferase chain/domain